MANPIRRTLAGLRWRIRAYVWLEGMLAALVWLGVTFWAGLALDYLPILLGTNELPLEARGVLLAAVLVLFAGFLYYWVYRRAWLRAAVWAVLALGYLPILMGSNEMPLWARGVLLGVVAVVLAVILYNWVLRRVFVSLADRSMAVLLERRFGQFGDSLVTAVEMAEHPDHAETFNSAMLEGTGGHALSLISQVQMGKVFNFAPLMRNATLAVLFLAPIGVFFAANAQGLEIWLERFYMLQDRPWPRSARIEVVGIEVRRESSGLGRTPPPRIADFQSKSVKVAKGANVVLRVQADATAKVVPDVCVIYYRTAEGDRGRVNMRKVGRPRQGFQQYTFDNKPLKGILYTTDFDVFGFDHRVRDYRIEVVDSPAVVETKLDCVFPAYMVDPTLSSWLPRTVDWTPATQLPKGTEITIRCATNKDLKQVQIDNPQTGEQTVIDLADRKDRRHFRYRVPQLSETLALEITLQDSDDVLSERPHRVVISAIDDNPPRVEVTLRGIGTAVTPDVRIPARGKIADDYGVARAWIETQVGEQDPRQHPIVVPDNGEVEAAVDFRELRSDPGGLELHPKEKLVLAVKAADRCNLEDGPNTGTGDHYQLDVVTPDELLAMLEVREAGLRRRFEQIIEEMTQTRDSLLRVKATQDRKGAEPGDVLTPAGADKKQDTPAAEEDAGNASDASEPGDRKAGATETDDGDAELRESSLRLLRVQRALLQSEKSSQEVLGVALAFRDIREELINNRVDSEDRKTRLKENVADPLEQIAKEMYPELDRRLKSLEKKLDDVQARPEAADVAVAQTDEILLAMDEVLQNLLKFETYNELLDIVRSLIKDQQRVMIETKVQQKKRALQLLE